VSRHGFLPIRTGKADLYQWLLGINQITGKPLAFMQLDIPWTDDGKKVPGAEFVSHEPADAITFYRQLEAFKGQEILDRIGIIHDGTELDTTDIAWVDDAKSTSLSLSNSTACVPTSSCSRPGCRIPPVHCQRAIPPRLPAWWTGTSRSI
jgi:hypothetical protein